MNEAKGFSLPMFAETEGGRFLSMDDGDVWQVGRTRYLHVDGRWFRLGKYWDHGIDGERMRSEAWLPSRGPRPGAMGVRLWPQEARTVPHLRLVVDNTAKGKIPETP